MVVRESTLSNTIFNSRVAQLVEHAAVNRRVVGSYPTSGANLWEYRIAAIARDCKSLGRKAYVGASPTAPTILFVVSRLTMLKKGVLVANSAVVESEWVYLYKISCYRL